MSIAALTQFALGSTTAAEAMREYIAPVMTGLIIIASIATAGFLAWGGYCYITSTGDAGKLDDAKRIIRNALIGLVLVIAAATVTAILTQSYSPGTTPEAAQAPSVQEVEVDAGGGITEVLLKSITGLLKTIVQAGAEPVVSSLGYFINSTPLMAENPIVFRMWLAIIGITNVVFILVVALLGFHIMSAASLGLDEVELKHMVPQLIAVFLLINTSIFAIDGIINLSNAMIHAFQSAFPSTSLWLALSGVVDRADGFGIFALLLMLVFVVLAVMLLVYYLGRIVVLYVGAILSPLVLLLWLVPAFRDFSVSAIKAYLTTIFVLFVHVVIFLLASSLFSTLLPSTEEGPNPILAMALGAATVVALLKTQGVMQEMSYVATGPRALRNMGKQFVSGVSTLSRGGVKTMKAVKGMKK